MIQERVLLLLEDALRVTGESKYAMCIGILRSPNRTGRKAIDDGQTLADMREMIECGMARNPSHAAKLALAGKPCGHSEAASVDRLVRKYAAGKRVIPVPSADVARVA